VGYIYIICFVTSYASSGSHDLDEDIISGVLKLRACGEPLEPIIRLLAARFLNADVEEEAAMRYFAYKALAALFAGRAGFLRCFWQRETGGRAALEAAFPDLMIHGGFTLGSQQIKPQNVKAILKQDGTSPREFAEAADLGSFEERGAHELVRLGLQAKVEGWTLRQEVVLAASAGGGEYTDCRFCKVEKLSEKEDGLACAYEVVAGGLTLDSATGRGTDLDGKAYQAFALEWS